MRHTFKLIKIVRVFGQNRNPFNNAKRACFYYAFMKIKHNRRDVARLTDSVIGMFESLAERYIDSQHRGIALNADHQSKQTIAGVSSSQLRNSAYANPSSYLSGRLNRALNTPKTKFGLSMTANAQTLQPNAMSSRQLDNGNDYKGAERRHNNDRRNYGLRTLWRCLMEPRRYNGRRREDRRFPLMDTFDSTAMCLAVTLMVLSITDAVLTLNILAAGGEEVNPVMNHMLGYGTFAFVASKMLMTAIPLTALTAAGNLVVYNFVRVRTLTATLVGLYCGLIVYELTILSAI